MIQSTLLRLVLALFCIASSVAAQSSSGTPTSSGAGYVGYSLGVQGDPDSVVYDTDETDTDTDPAVPTPDVYLNASVSIDEIDITVNNLTAKINLDAQVLQLLQFNAGVDVSINEVQLLIQNVTAKAVLEARLQNVVQMINDTLDSIDLNPIIASLGSDVGELLNGTAGAVGGLGSALGGGTGSSGTNSTGSLGKRSPYDLVANILFAVNDYTGNTHRNRVLAQDGSIVDEFLHNDGMIYTQQIVGSYKTNMTFAGGNSSSIVDGQVVRGLEYVYNPFAGLSVVSTIYLNTAGDVVGTQVISESGAQGTSTIGDTE